MREIRRGMGRRECFAIFAPGEYTRRKNRETPSRGIGGKVLRRFAPMEFFLYSGKNRCGDFMGRYSDA
jgi:hypothetical protein